MRVSNPEGEFRKVPSLFFLYEVNEYGTILRNVKSKRRIKVDIVAHNSPTQYRCCQLNIKHHVRKVFLHNLVAECWLDAKPEGRQTDHIDRNSLNNHYSNLRYVTKSEQMKNRNIPEESMQNIVQPVVLKGKGKEICFETSRRAATYLASVYGKKVKSFSDKLHHRRARIFDYDVIYL